jgi:hypothetical protein
LLLKIKSFKAEAAVAAARDLQITCSLPSYLLCKINL